MSEALQGAGAPHTISGLPQTSRAGAPYTVATSEARVCLYDFGGQLFSTTPRPTRRLHAGNPRFHSMQAGRGTSKQPPHGGSQGQFVHDQKGQVSHDVHNDGGSHPTVGSLRCRLGFVRLRFRRFSSSKLCTSQNITDYSGFFGLMSTATQLMSAELSGLHQADLLCFHEFCSLTAHVVGVLFPDLNLQAFA